MLRVFSLLTCTLIMSLLIPTTAQAVPTIDGILNPSEGYTHQSIFQPSKLDHGLPGPGTMYMTQDTSSKDLFLAVVLPKSYVDNTYGINAIGWGHKGHKFKDLVDSDKAQFTLSLGHHTVLDVTFDYLSETAKNSGAYVSGIAGKEGAINSGPSNAIVASHTSLDYNINSLVGGKNYLVDSPATDANYTPNAAIPGWVSDVVYEFQVNGDVLNNLDVLGNGGGFLNDFGIELTSLHASPSKGGEFTGIIPPPPSAVPEPASMSLLGLGALTLLTRPRKHRRK